MPEIEISCSELEIEHCLEMLLPRLQKKIDARHDTVHKKVCRCWEIVFIGGQTSTFGDEAG